MNSKPQLSAITFCNMLRPFSFEMSLFPSVPSPQKDRKGSILTKEAPTAFIRYGETAPFGSENSYTQAYTTRELADSSRASLYGLAPHPPAARTLICRARLSARPSKSIRALSPAARSSNRAPCACCVRS